MPIIAVRRLVGIIMDDHLLNFGRPSVAPTAAEAAAGTAAAAAAGTAVGCMDTHEAIFGRESIFFSYA